MAAHRKTYFKVFGALFVLTVLEIGVVYMGISRALLATALVGLAITKACLVALYFMHLKTERLVLRRMVYLPLLVPPFYAAVLMADAIARRIAG
jgi:cytochrome c oxidase subunit 4